MTNENKNTNEETMTHEEVIEAIVKTIDITGSYYKILKIRLVKRGFIMGLLTALTVQSLATILIMLIVML